MKAVLVLNGEPPSLTRLQQLGQQFPIYAADGGASVCMVAGVRPEWVAGDFDSQRLDTLPEDWQVYVVPEQDRTDFQKVLGKLPEEVDDLLILGALGRRTDHLLSNLLIAMTLPDAFKVTFEGEGQLLYRITPSCPLEENLRVGGILSLLPLSRIQRVNTSGLKWELSNAEMGPGIQLGQSNQVEKSTVRIEVGEGSLFVWVDRCSRGQTGLF